MLSDHVKRIRGWLLLSVAFLFLSCEPLGPHALLSDTLELDRAFIPLLTSASEPDLSDAAAALDSFEKEWKQFDAVHHHYSGMYWEACLNEVSEQIEGARLFISEGQTTNLNLALERIRERLMQARERIGMLYLPDALTRVDHALDSLVVAADSAGIQVYCYDMTSVERYWQDVVTFSWTPSDYGLDEAEAAVVGDRIATLDHVIEQLSCYDDGNRATAVSADHVAHARQTLAEIYQQFGSASR